VKFTAVASLICLVLFVYFAVSHRRTPATAPKFSLGRFGTSWARGVTTQIANAISGAPFAGDYAGYIPSSAKPRALVGSSFFGMVAGCILVLTCGEIISLALQDPFNATSAMIDNVPMLLLAPIVLVGLIGNIRNGAWSSHPLAVEAGACRAHLRRDWFDLW
jgi:purine-cytosine permease-like protein